MIDFRVKWIMRSVDPPRYLRAMKDEAKKRVASPLSRRIAKETRQQIRSYGFGPRIAKARNASDMKWSKDMEVLYRRSIRVSKWTSGHVHGTGQRFTLSGARRGQLRRRGELFTAQIAAAHAQHGEMLLEAGRVAMNAGAKSPLEVVIE